MEKTTTEHDMDSAAQQLTQSFRGDSSDVEPDLAVDGLSESIVAKLFRLLTFQRS